MWESTGRSRLGGLANGDVINIQIEPVATIEVANGHIAHAAVSTQVNRVLIPNTLFAGVATTWMALVVCNFVNLRSIAERLGRHRPFVKYSEGIGVCVACGRNGYAEVLSSPSIILSASPEADATTESYLRRNEVIIRIESTNIIVVAHREHAIIRSVMAISGTHYFGSKHPIIAITISIDGGPTLHTVVIEVEHGIGQGSPMDLHIRTIRVLNIRIILGNHTRDWVEQLVQINIDATCQVIKDNTYGASIRLVLIAVARGHGNIWTCPQGTFIITIGIGGKVECVVIAILIIAWESNRGILYARSTVLFVHMAFNGS